MLAGIKRGKKKAKPSERENPESSSARPAEAAPRETNISAAAALKAALSQGQNPQQALSSANGDASSTTAAAPSKIILTNATLPTLSSQREEDMTAAELAAHERRTGMAGDSAYDEETRALLRAHKRRKKRANRKDDSDEEVDTWQDRHTKATSEKQQEKVQKRWQARQSALHAQQQALAQQSWWWMDSSRFDPSSLVAMSDDVSLVMAPANKSWHPDTQKYPHFYLVPLPATASGTACDETVWQQVQSFQNSLRQWSQSQGRQVVFAEVVLPSSSSNKTSAFYQAKIHAMVVPKRLHQDAALVFQSALQELVRDQSTHQKKIHKLREGKPLPYMVPNHFAYLYVEFDPNQGFVLVLEERSRDVTPDWPLDVLGGRMGLDPVRMRRAPQSSSSADMKERVRTVQESYKDFDWTSTSS